MFFQPPTRKNIALLKWYKNFTQKYPSALADMFVISQAESMQKCFTKAPCRIRLANVGSNENCGPRFWGRLQYFTWSKKKQSMKFRLFWKGHIILWNITIPIINASVCASGYVDINIHIHYITHIYHFLDEFQPMVVYHNPENSYKNDPIMEWIHTNLCKIISIKHLKIFKYVSIFWYIIYVKQSLSQISHNSPVTNQPTK